MNNEMAGCINQIDLSLELKFKDPCSTPPPPPNPSAPPPLLAKAKKILKPSPPSHPNYSDSNIDWYDKYKVKKKKDFLSYPKETTGMQAPNIIVVCPKGKAPHENSSHYWKTSMPFFKIGYIKKQFQKENQTFKLPYKKCLCSSKMFQVIVSIRRSK